MRLLSAHGGTDDGARSVHARVSTMIHSGRLGASHVGRSAGIDCIENVRGNEADYSSTYIAISDS